MFFIKGVWFNGKRLKYSNFKICNDENKQFNVCSCRSFYDLFMFR